MADVDIALDIVEELIKKYPKISDKEFEKKSKKYERKHKKEIQAKRQRQIDDYNQESEVYKSKLIKFFAEQKKKLKKYQLAFGSAQGGEIFLNLFKRKNFKNFSLICDLDKIKDKYSNSYLFSGSAWIKTPSIVLSKSKEDMAMTTGGHNIGAALSHFKVVSTLKQYLRPMRII